MRPITIVSGILLILFGVFAFSYQGFTYTQQEQVAQIANFQVTADTQRTVFFPPLLSGLCLVGGIVLVVIGSRMNRK